MCPLMSFWNVTLRVWLPRSHMRCRDPMFNLRLWRATRQSLLLSRRQRKILFPHGSGCLLDESDLQLILDLHLLNLKLRTCSFRILTLKHILSQSWTGDWFITIDLKDAFSIFRLSRNTQSSLGLPIRRILAQSEEWIISHKDLVLDLQRLKNISWGWSELMHYTGILIKKCLNLG